MGLFNQAICYSKNMVCFLFFLLWCGSVYALDCNANGESIDIKKEEVVQEVSSPNRLYFYTYPDESCKDENVFILKGDVVKSFGTYNEFTFILYNSNSSAWVKTEGLDKVDMKAATQGAPLSYYDFMISDGEVIFGLENSIEYVLSQGDWFKKNIAKCDSSELGTDYHTDASYDAIISTNNSYVNPDFYKFFDAEIPETLNCEGNQNKLMSNFITAIHTRGEFKTFRGITQGSTIEEVYEAYGRHQIIAPRQPVLGRPIYYIRYKEYQMEFEMFDYIVGPIILTREIR